MFGALERQNHIAPGTIDPPFFLPSEMDWNFLDPPDVNSIKRLMRASCATLAEPLCLATCKGDYHNLNANA